MSWVHVRELDSELFMAHLDRKWKRSIRDMLASFLNSGRKSRRVVHLYWCWWKNHMNIKCLSSLSNFYSSLLNWGDVKWNILLTLMVITFKLPVFYLSFSCVYSNLLTKHLYRIWIITCWITATVTSRNGAILQHLESTWLQIFSLSVCNRLMVPKEEASLLLEHQPWAE